MKKFIALVLSLVMALSLCVPAFGAESKPVEVDNADDLVAALGEGNDVIMTDDITIDPASLSSGYGTTGVVIKNGQTFDGGGNTLIIKNANKTWDSGIATSGGVIKNLTVYGSFRGIFVLGNDKKAVLENVTVGGDGTVYTVHCDSGKGAGLEATNCTFNGWTSFAKTLGNATFTNCSFGAGSGYAFCRPYATATFVGCSFAEGYKLGAQADVYFDNCTLGGKTLTAADLATFVVENPENATVLSNAVIPEVEVEAAAPEVSVDSTKVDTSVPAVQEIVTNITAAGGVTLDETALTEVADVVASNTEVTDAEAVAALLDAGHSAADATVVVEPYFDVVVEAVDVANATITLDITPMYQVVATNGTDKVDIGQPQEMTIPEGKPVEITVKIPDALAVNGKLYVTHDGAEIYEATVTGTTSAFFATFTTTSGFSPYVFSLTPPAVIAVVNGVNYADLQAAIDAAPAGATVKLMADNAENVTVGKAITIDFNGKNYTGKVTAAPGYVYMSGKVMKTGNNFNSSTSAGTTTTVKPTDKYEIYPANATNKLNLTVKSFTSLATMTVTIDGVTTKGYIPAHYTVSDGSYTYYLYECDASCADVRIFKGNSFVTYARYDVADKDFLSDTAVKVEKAKGCGNYAVDVYVINGEDAYAPAATGKLAIMNGKYVCYAGTEVTKTPHDFAKLAVTYKSVTDNTIVSITCDKCEKPFTVVKNGKIPANYKGAVDTTTLTPVYTILLDSVTSAPVTGGTTTKVESAETFDAGIAMYVGMSVMAAAGSAVVLKKKD